MIPIKKIIYFILLFNLNTLFSQEIESGSQEIITTKDSLSFYLHKFRPISKSISFSNSKAMRVSYVYLDGSQLSMEEINKLRTKIISEYKKGTSFATLANTNSMDSSKDGDLGWFDEGQMEGTFQDAILKHKKGAIFTVDIPSNKWFYVVLKTFDDIEKMKITYILN